MCHENDDNERNHDRKSCKDHPQKCRKIHQMTENTKECENPRWLHIQQPPCGSCCAYLGLEGQDSSRARGFIRSIQVRAILGVHMLLLTVRHGTRCWRERQLLVLECQCPATRLQLALVAFNAHSIASSLLFHTRLPILRVPFAPAASVPATESSPRCLLTENN